MSFLVAIVTVALFGFQLTSSFKFSRPLPQLFSKRVKTNHCPTAIRKFQPVSCGPFSPKLNNNDIIMYKDEDSPYIPPGCIVRDGEICVLRDGHPYPVKRTEEEIQQSYEDLVSEIGGFKTWEWKGYLINYFSLGIDADSHKKPSIFLIHGSVAPSFHWRKTIAVLSEKYNVYAMDLLGFGRSGKPRQEYGMHQWNEQVLDFIEQIVAPVYRTKDASAKVPCVVAGNCIGGDLALIAATSPRAVENNLISGCIMVNGELFFAFPPEAPEKVPFSFSLLNTLRQELYNVYRFAEKGRISTLLEDSIQRRGYPKPDEELVHCIHEQLDHPDRNAVQFRIGTMRNNKVHVHSGEKMLAALKVPFLYLYGTQVILHFLKSYAMLYFKLKAITMLYFVGYVAEKAVRGAYPAIASGGGAR